MICIITFKETGTEEGWNEEVEYDYLPPIPHVGDYISFKHTTGYVWLVEYFYHEYEVTHVFIYYK